MSVKPPPIHCPTCQTRLDDPSKQPFGEQTIPVKIGIIIIGALLLGLAVWLTGAVWTAAVEVWS